MSLTASARVATGFCVGGAGAFAISELGLPGITGFANTPIWMLVLGIAGAAGALRGYLAWFARSGAVLLAVYFVVAFTPVAGTLARSRVRADRLPWDTLAAAVVLSSNVTSDTSLNVGGTDRLLAGIELVQRGTARQLITTRVAVRHDGRIVSTDADQERLVRMAGIKSWVVLDTVYTTRDEAVRAAALLQPRGIKRIAVVTSPLHSRRACATFEGAGFEVVCVPARERDAARWSPVSASDRLISFRSWTYEMAGTVKYRLAGWI